MGDPVMGEPCSTQRIALPARERTGPITRRSAVPTRPHYCGTNGGEAHEPRVAGLAHPGPWNRDAGICDRDLSRAVRGDGAWSRRIWAHGALAVEGSNREARLASRAVGTDGLGGAGGARHWYRRPRRRAHPRAAHAARRG